MPAANGIYKLAVIGTVAGQQHVHTMHFRSTIDPDSLVMTEEQYFDALLSAWQTNARTQYRAIFTTDHSPVQTYQLRKVCGSLPLPAGLDASESAPNQGGTTNGAAVGAGEAAAPWLANVVTERTALAGRRYRGRFVLGGLYEGFISGATVLPLRLTPTGAYTTALTAAFVTPADVDTPFRAFVYSRTQALEFPTAPCQTAGADVRTYQVRDVLATMKSRKAGSGI
jgi:hypothetical protein